MSVSNVILLTIDSLRWDCVDAEDSSRVLPEMSALREDAILFTKAFANGSNTPSSFPTILTSTHPLMYGGYGYLDDDRPFVSRTLRNHGYRTAAFHSNPHLGADQNYDAGFQTFNDSAEGSDSVATLKDRTERALDPDSLLYRVLRRAWHYFSLTTDTSAYAKASTITRNARGWLNSERDRSEPFFLWLHYMDVHYPFTPPTRFLNAVTDEPPSKRRIADLNGKMQENPDQLTERDVKDLRTLYDGEIRHTDHYVGELVTYLEERGIFEDTALFVTADHGEAFGEHGRFGHHPSPYDELIHVPLLARVPGFEPRTVEQQVSLIDFGPTIYDLLNIEPPDSVQGRSLLPLMRGKSLDEKPVICTTGGGDVLACRTPRWKCIWRLVEDRIELYNLESDPGETTDVSEAHPAVADELLDQLATYREQADETDVALPEVKRDERVEDRLRELGYLE